MEPAAPVPPAAHPRRLYLPLLLIAGVLAFTDLGGRSVHDIDVPRGAALAREMLQSGEWIVPLRAGEIYTQKPPLYIWFVAAPAALAGDVTPFLARLPAALAFIALVLACAWWTRMRTGSVTAARIAGLLALSTLALAWLGREAKLDMLAAALSVWGAALIDAAAHGRAHPRLAIVAGVVLGLGLLTKGPLVLLVAAAVLLAGGEPGTRLGRRLHSARLGRTLCFALLVALAWFLPALLLSDAGYGEALLVDQAAKRLSGLGDHLEPLWYYLVALLHQARPWGVIYLVIMAAALVPKAAAKLGPTAGLARAALALLVLYSLFPTKHIRYLAPALPLAAIPLAWWIRTSVLPRVPALPRWCGAFAVVTFVGAAVVIVACRLSTVGGWAAIVPAAGLLLTGAWAYRRRAVAGTLVYALLLGSVCAVSAETVLRYRFRIPRHVRFNRQVAETLRAGDAQVWTVAPWYPEDLFLGAPHARYLGAVGAGGAATPAPGAVVVCRASDLAALEAARGKRARILFEEPTHRPRLIVRFD